MQLITWGENDKKYKDFVKTKIKSVNIQSGEELEFESIRFAGRELNIAPETIARSIRKNTIAKQIYKFNYV